MMRAASTASGVTRTTTPTSRALLQPLTVPRRVCACAANPGKPGQVKDDHHHGLISVWDDKELAESEKPQGIKLPSSDKHSLVSVWEDHELKEEEQKVRKDKADTILNHPSGDKPQASNYDSEW